MGTKVNLGAGSNVIAFLKEQHDEIKSMFGKVLTEDSERREHAFAELCLLMSVHETAEEDIVHPVAAHSLGGGRAMVAARLREETEAKEAIAELETLDVGSTDFEAKFRKLEKAVLAHAESEEREEFEKLGKVLDAPELLRMRNDVVATEASATPDARIKRTRAPARDAALGPTRH